MLLFIIAGVNEDEDDDCEDLVRCFLPSRDQPVVPNKPAGTVESVKKALPGTTLPKPSFNS